MGLEQAKETFIIIFDLFISGEEHVVVKIFVIVILEMERWAPDRVRFKL